MKFIKNMRIGSATLFGLSLLSFAGNLWGMEPPESSQEESFAEGLWAGESDDDSQKKNFYRKMLLPSEKDRKKELSSLIDKALTENRLLIPYSILFPQTNYQETLISILADKDEQPSAKEIKDIISEISFEFWNKTKQNISIQLGNEKYSTWINVGPGWRIFSAYPITRFKYNLSPDKKDAKEFKFNLNPGTNKIFVKLEKKGKTLQFMAQEGTGKTLPLGSLYKIGRKAGVKRGKLSFTQSGLSLANSIEDTEIIPVNELTLEDFEIME